MYIYIYTSKNVGCWQKVQTQLKPKFKVYAYIQCGYIHTKG